MRAFRVWYGGVMPIWISTPVYLAMGWRSISSVTSELAKTYSHSNVAAASSRRSVLQHRGQS